MFFRRLHLNLLRLTQPCKSLTCRLLIHRLVGLQLGKLVVSQLATGSVANSQLVGSQCDRLATWNLLAHNAHLIGTQGASRTLANCISCLVTRNSLACNL